MEDLTEQARLALADMAWVRQLARALVRDDAAADDIAQDALLVATAKAPSDRPLRPWLHRVMLNLVRMRARSDTRRDAREATMADGASQSATPEELVARVEIQRVVASEVLELREPYRSTILMHFVEGLTSVEIAKQLDIPEGTVRRRLKTALDELRTRLKAREDQPKGGWLAALVPLAGLPDPTPARAAPAGSAAISAPVVVAILVALAGCAIGVWWWLRPGAPAATPSASPPTLTVHPAAPARPVPDSVVPAWLVQDRVQARRIAGVVTSSGIPLPRATVRLAVVVSPSQTLLVAERTAGVDGRFDFGMQPAASFLVSAQGPQRMPASTPIDLADPRAAPDKLAIDLDPCFAQLTGTVRDASGGPIARARLSLTGQVSTLADESGAFSLCLPWGERIRVDADGYGSRDVPTYLLSGTARLDIVLVPEAAVIGRVVDTEKHPIAGAQVTVTPEGVRGPFGLAANLARTDADGRFRVAGIGPGKFRIAAHAKGFATATPTVIFAQPGTESRELELVVTARRRVTGTVTMAGKPASGVRIMVIEPQKLPMVSLEPGPSAISQADGSFELESLPGTFTVFSTNHDVVSPQSITIADADITAAVEVTRRGTVHGRVMAHGVPQRNAEVYCISGVASAAARSGADGRFTCTNLSPGKNTLMAQVPATSRFGTLTVDLAPGQELSNVDFELPWAGRMQGRVVDEAGHPVPDVAVFMIAPDGDRGACPTNARGEFDCGGLSGGGDYVVTVHPTMAMQTAFAPLNCQPPRIHVADGEAVVKDVQIAIELARSALRGRILDDKGIAFSDCHITAASEMSPQPLETAMGARFEPPTTMSARDGSFEFANLAPGFYNLAVMCPDNATGEHMRAEAGGGPITIEIARAGRITGRLVGFNSIPAVHTYRFTEFTSMGYMAVVEGDRFTFDGVPAGEFPVEVIAGEQMDGALVDVKAGSTTDIVLTARPTTVIEGRVVDRETGAGVAGFNCQARVVTGGYHGDLIPIPVSLPTDASGHFSVVAPLGLTRVLCVASPGPFTFSPGGVDVTLPSRDAIEVPIVRVMPPGSFAGFRLTPMKLPLTVQAIDPGGPAASSGLQVGDQLRSIDGAPVDGLIPMSAMVTMFNHPEGKPLKLTVERAGATISIEIIPAHNGPVQ